MAHVGERPGWIVEAGGQCLVVDGKIGRTADGGVEIHEDLELIHVNDAVDVVNVFGEQRLGGAHGDNGLQCRWISHGQLDGIETTPGNSEHSYTAVRPGLAGKPGNDLQAISLLLLRVL